MYEQAYRQGKTFGEFLGGAVASRDLWMAVAARVTPPKAALDRVSATPGRWRLLALADDWCGDAVNILPVVAKLAEAAENLELRIVGREEVPGLMERHLTGTSRAIPVFVLLDEEGTARGWWGPRPGPLQRWFEVEGRRLDKTERYRELRRWYARDHGATTAGEIADLVACGAAGDEPPYRGTCPCASLRAA